MKNLIISILAIAVLTLSVSADGKKYSNKKHGYNFVAPEGWAVKEKGDDCPTFTLSNSEGTIAVVVSTAHTTDMADYFNNEYKVIDLGFSPVGRVQERNGYQGISFVKNVEGAQMVMNSILKPLGDSDSVVVMAISGRDYLEEANKYVVKIMNSVKLSFGRRFKTGIQSLERTLEEQNRNGSNGGGQSNAPMPASAQSSPWGRVLAGKVLKTFKNGSERVFRFCGGNFSHGYGSLNSSQNGNGSISGNMGGRWDIQGNTLILRYGDGNIANYQLSDLNEGDSYPSVKLDGVVYLTYVADCS